MNYWIINHKYSSYLEHKNIIGIPVKKDRQTGDPYKDDEGNLIPKYTITNQIEVGDRFAYYCPAPKMVVIGLFEIENGPGQFAEDWNESIHFKIKPIHPVKEENSVSYYDLVENLNFFKDSEGNVLDRRSASMKLWGTIKSIEEEDYNKIKSLYIGSDVGVPPLF